MNPRIICWLGALVVLLISATAYGQLVDRFDDPSQFRVYLFCAMGVSGLVATFSFPSFRSRWGLWAALWVPVILVRCALLPTAPSDDINRYLWEGKLLLEGISPYSHLADSGELEIYRDQYWVGMNHKDQPTAYPPLVLFGFAAVGALSYTPIAFKLAFLVGDLLTFGGVLWLLRKRGLGLWYSGFYSLSPLVLLSYAGEGHFDSWMVGALTIAVAFLQLGRWRVAVVAASVATGIKVITLPLLPFFAGNRLLLAACISVTVGLIPILPFASSIGHFVEGVFLFGGTRSFNGPVYEWLLHGVGFSRQFCSALAGVSLLAVIVWRWRIRECCLVDSHIRWILGTLIVLSPTVHFWYLAWLIPFVSLRPSLPWLTLSVTSGAYFWVWTNAIDGRGWGLSPWQIGLFWTPFFLSLIYEVWSTRGRVLRPFKRSGENTLSARPTVSVIIPTLNALGDLPAALVSITNQTVVPDEIIVVDADSTDGTIEWLKTESESVQWIRSDRGRGLQIAAGVEAVKGDWVVVFHADSRLPLDAIERLLRAVQADPAILGGALGQRFSGQSFQLWLIEAMNDVRALLTRTAFGDQVQFFHRETALEHQLIPRQPLMEDVEASWRLRELGGFLFLGTPAAVSSLKWAKEPWIQRVRLVLSLVSRYRGARFKSREAAERLSQDLYLEYYPRKED